jgi:hypothetical protein
MCVSQFREYCKAHRFTDRPEKDEAIEASRGTFFSYGRQLRYVKNVREMKRLAQHGNEYAKQDLVSAGGSIGIAQNCRLTAASVN